MLDLPSIRIRDPFSHADTTTQTYYLYAQSGNRPDSGFLGVEAYTSEDLVHWHRPQPVLVLPEDAGIGWVWAPEVHAFCGGYYLFVTLTLNRILTDAKPVAAESWPDLLVRGTYIYRGDGPAGPVRPLKHTSHTPVDWMALDGTFMVEDGCPYMVFCHEWVQLIDGTMDLVKLEDDLSDAVGAPAVLFKASDAPGAPLGAPSGADEGKVTDGCFLYRSAKSRRLFMIWSTFIRDDGYCVVLSRSASDHIMGPWTEHTVIYRHDGGHGMLFEAFDGRLLMALHQPNVEGRERLHLFGVTDDGERLAIADEVGVEG